jgi:O-antigen ligase
MICKVGEKTMKTKQLSVVIPAGLIIVILALIPFHAFLTVWLSSLVGHYTSLRLWKECLVAICFIATLYIYITDKSIRKFLNNSRLIWAILVFISIELIWGLVAFNKGNLNLKALLYGWLSDCRYLIFFVITLVIAKKTSKLNKQAIGLVIWPAVIVIVFGLLQILVLPKDFLSHFGYSLSTIPAYETINHNSHYIRIASTLRGANPLGAYLLIPLSLASVLLIRGRKRRQMLALLITGTIVMIFSFSRSAWLGLVVAIALAIYWGLKSAKLKKQLVYLAVALVIILGGITIVERNNPHVQNIVFHTQSHSAIKTSSDQGHSSALKQGIKQVLEKPLGTGPGTSGPASVYNKKPASIPENYYIQIGQETGWLGLIVFIVINILVAMSLWVRRADSLSLALLASFTGLVICNMLLEAWTDDTLCYLWWGLAAIVIASQPNPKKSNWIL